MPSINIKLTDEELEELKEFKKKKDETWKRFLFRGLWLKGCLLREPDKTFDSWAVDDLEKYKGIKREKPCHKTGICPYGQLVEEFPILRERNEFSCKVFGHNCPVFYCAAPYRE